MLGALQDDIIQDEGKVRMLLTILIKHSIADSTMCACRMHNVPCLTVQPNSLTVHCVTAQGLEHNYKA